MIIPEKYYGRATNWKRKEERVMDDWVSIFKIILSTITQERSNKEKNQIVSQYHGIFNSIFLIYYDI